MAYRLPHRLLCAGLSIAAFAGGAQAAGPETYSLDPVHTRVVFRVEHAGFSHAMGAISGSSGTLRFDPDDWRSAQLDVTVPIARLDLGDAKWNSAVLAANLLDGRRHPDAHFVSDQVDGIDADHARVCGELTLRGVTGPLCMDVTFNALKRHPLPPFRRTAGFSATATLSRKAFGIVAWPTVIGDEVNLLIEAEGVRHRGGIEAGQPAADAIPPEDAAIPAEDGAVPAEDDESQPDREPDSLPPASDDP